MILTDRYLPSAGRLPTRQRIRPRVQFVLTANNDLTTLPFNTNSTRYYIESIAFLTELNTAANLIIGSDIILAGIHFVGGQTSNNMIPCAMIIDSGQDVSLVAANGISPLFLTGPVNHIVF